MKIPSFINSSLLSFPSLEKRKIPNFHVLQNEMALSQVALNRTPTLLGSAYSSSISTHFCRFILTPGKYVSDMFVYRVKNNILQCKIVLQK